MSRYKTEYEVGENGFSNWVQPAEDDYKMACCDCGLVHRMEFRVYEGRAQFRAKRHMRATAAIRAAKRRKALAGISERQL